MILQLKHLDGKTIIYGGDISFIVDKNKFLTVYCKDYVLCRKLKDYPTYSVGGNFIYCEEAIEQK